MSESPKVIGTHNGKFHADEVLGCFLLCQHPEYKSAIIKRSRDPKVLDQCDIVIDVGGVYDHETKRYDHHQRGFHETFETVAGIECMNDIKLSSAGLVWAHYGKDIISAVVEKELSVKDLHDVFCRVYDMLVKEVDAKDNGIEASNPPYRYRICTDYASRVSRLNASEMFPERNEETQFMKAVELAGQEFFAILDHILKLWLPSRVFVSESLDDRFSVDESGRIMKIDRPGIQWPGHLRDIEKEKKIITQILYVLFPDSQNGWRVQAVSREGGFDLRQPVLPSCLALRGDELIAKCGILDAIFVHATGFIGGAKSFEGALKMARMSLLEGDLNKSNENSSE